MAKKRKKTKARKVSRPRKPTCPAGEKRLGMASSALLNSAEAIRNGSIETADTALMGAMEDLDKVYEVCPAPEVEEYMNRLSGFREKFGRTPVGEFDMAKNELAKEAQELGVTFHDALLTDCKRR
jgi:hypothetical protein